MIFMRASSIYVCLSLLALLVAVASWFSCDQPLRVPVRRVSFNGGTPLPHASVDESKKRVAFAAPYMLEHGYDGSLPLRDKTAVLNSAIDLASTNDPNAEYIIGWMYETGECQYDTVSNFVDNRPLPFPLKEYRDAIRECIWSNSQSLRFVMRDREQAVQWYKRAVHDGSPQAMGWMVVYVLGSPVTDEQVAQAYLCGSSGK